MADMSNATVEAQEVYRLFKLYSPPERIKTASAAALATPQDLASHLYADQRNKQYPTHTAAATWLSIASFLEKEAEYAPAEGAEIHKRLQHSASFHGLAAEFRDLQEKVAAAVIADLDALPDEDFAYVWRSDLGVERRMPLRNATEVKLAADYLKTHRSAWRLEDRKVMATKVLNKVASTQAVLTEQQQETLRCMAGKGGCTAKVAADAVATRAALVRPRDAKMADLMTKLASEIWSNPNDIHKAGRRDELANRLDTFDRAYNLTNQYDGRPLRAPEEVLYGFDFTKSAAAALEEHTRLATGAVFEKYACTTVPLTDWRDLYGDDFAAKVSLGGIVLHDKLADALTGMDMSQARLAETVLKNSGITPVFRDDVKYGLDDKKLQELLQELAGVSTGS
jgi:hypothetical protein